MQPTYIARLFVFLLKRLDFYLLLLFIDTFFLYLSIWLLTVFAVFSVFLMLNLKKLFVMY
jgi:hypothetical protein